MEAPVHAASITNWTRQRLATEAQGTAKKQFSRPTKPFRACGAKSLKPSLLIVHDMGPRIDPRPARSTTRGHQMALTSSKIGRSKLVITTALMFGLLTVSQAYTLQQQQMCTGDALRLCGSEIPNVERITACMERQRESLSDGCKAVFEADTPVAATESSVNDKPATRLAKPISLAPKFKHG
jgi:hypothetical protein